jgi:TonB family protein
MEIPAKKFVKLLAEHDPASPEFREGLRETLHSRGAAPEQTFSGQAVTGEPSSGRSYSERSSSVASSSGLTWAGQSSGQRVVEFDLWKDVFVQQRLPWARFVESALIHACAAVLIWTLSLVWLRQQRILDTAAFDRSSLITYSPEEYLPPLDTGAGETPKPRVGDPAFAKQPILSVPREADNRRQTIVAPPDLKLDRDVPLPNIVATGTVAPMVPLNATNSLSSRVKAPDSQVVAPAPEVAFARDRVTQAGLRSDIIPPPPEVKHDRARGMAGPDTAVIAPPPEVTSARGHAGQMNIAPSAAVAPAPQLTLAEQHAIYGRGQAGGKDLAAGTQAVAPAPSVSGGAGGASGRLVALGINPITPTGPVAVPGGNRRGSFEAGPQGKAGATGAPDFAGSKTAGNGTGWKTSNGQLPAGLRVGAAPGRTGAIARDGEGADDGAREMASANAAGTIRGRRAASAIADEKVTSMDREVFGDRRLYGTTLNMPNLNSTSGSWVMHFAELEPDPKQQDLMQPLPTEKSDPGYPLELIRNNVHGTVTLYAVIHADGRVDGIRVLNSPDERLDDWAKNALAGWKFMPALRAGKPVAVEALVEIPFRVRRGF